MSIARHHAEWLSLLEISGPFLSMPVLLRAFPQGLDAHDPDAFRELKLAYEEWQDNQGGLRPDPAIHTAWIRFVLDHTLELPSQVIAEGQAIPPSLRAVIAEHGETLRPDLVIVNPQDRHSERPFGFAQGRREESLSREAETLRSAQGDRQTRLLIQIYPPAQGLDKPAADRRWKASPAMRMMELLRACDIRLGLVTNGERWMLVDSPRDGTTGFISWYASLWQEEHITLRAFRSLLDAHRFFSVPDDETLEALLAESATDQQEVTAQLGYQVRRAVEVLIQSIDRADQDRGRKLLGTDVPTERLYEAALTVMMRLVFLFSAEERKLLLLGDPLYDQHYAVSTLRAQLREAADQHGEEVLERRLDAWCRLLATFRAVYGGIAHPDLKLPAYGGSLFDPDRFPFLEGRLPSPVAPYGDGGRVGDGGWRDTPADPLPINNRTVLHLLDALQMLQVKVPGGGPAEACRLSFRALDIEQIGHVYESLLDHTAVRATEPVLGLAGTRDKEPEIALAELEAQVARGEDDLVAYLQEQTGRSESALRKAKNEERGTKSDVAPRSTLHTQRLRAVCGNDESLYRRVLPFAGLIRDDDFGLPVVIPTGSVYVTAGADRRSTGTHYTPRSLTEPIVQHTLEPLVYIGPAEGKPREEWQLRPAAELLDLKICDMAMGSGAFLVQADRYLAERLVEAWENAEVGIQKSEVGSQRSEVEQTDTLPKLGRPRITPEGKPSTGAPGETLIPDDADERLSLARRVVADRCLYGVDKNPLAVEMAKLSLWLVTLAKDRPFTFLDHALKCGDSLVGADEDMFQRWAHGLRGSEMTLFDEQLRGQLVEARSKRRELESFEVKDVRDAERKAALLAEADRALERVKLGCDLIIGVRLLDLPAKVKEARLNTLLLDYMAGKLDTFLTSGHSEARRAEESVLREKETLRSAQGDIPNAEAQAALDAARKVRVFHWPFEFPEIFERGGFSAFVGNPPFQSGKGGLNSIAAIFGEGYVTTLEDLHVRGKRSADICAYFFLRARTLLSSIGCYGFIATNSISEGTTREVALDPLLAAGGSVFFAEDSKTWPGDAAVLISIIHASKRAWHGTRSLNGQSVHWISARLDPEFDLGEPFRLSESVVAFHGTKPRGDFLVDMGGIEFREFGDANLPLYLSGQDINSSVGPSASRRIILFPQEEEQAAHRTNPRLFEVLRSKVYEYRQSTGIPKLMNYWWRSEHDAQELYDAIKQHSLSVVYVACRVSNTFSLARVSSDQMFADGAVVFLLPETWHFAVLQSSLYQVWVRKYCSTFKEDIRFNVKDVVVNFPLPKPMVTSKKILNDLGERYIQCRQSLLLSREIGLSGCYNRLFHSPSESSADISRLRALHVEMDQAVAAAYGWEDLDLGHGFHETAQGVRYTISEPARREVLARLLALNHKRYEEEVQAGLHDKGTRASGHAQADKVTRSKKGKGKKAGKEQLGLL